MVNATLADASIRPRLSTALFSLEGDDPACVSASLGRDGETDTNEASTPGLIPRSASSTHLSAASADTVDHASNNERNGIRRTFSENVLSTLDSGRRRSVSSAKPTKGSPQATTPKKLVRRKSGLFRKDMKTNVSGITVEEKQANLEFEALPKLGGRVSGEDHESKARSTPRSWTDLARKSWLGASRSPSPNKRDNAITLGASAVTSTPPPSEAASSGHWDALSARDNISPQRKNTFGQKQRRPLSTILGKSVVLAEVPKAGADSPVIPLLPKAFSYDKLSSLQYGNEHKGHVPLIPRSTIVEKSFTFGLEVPRKKDELWGAFRTLDGEYQKYGVKIIRQKTTY